MTYICVQISGPKTSQVTGYYYTFTTHSSDSLDELNACTLQQAMTTSFHILICSLITDNPSQTKLQSKILCAPPSQSFTCRLPQSLIGF